jgi:hypothetical protein
MTWRHPGQSGQWNCAYNYAFGPGSLQHAAKIGESGIKGLICMWASRSRGCSTKGGGTTYTHVLARAGCRQFAISKGRSHLLVAYGRPAQQRLHLCPRTMQIAATTVARQRATRVTADCHKRTSDPPWSGWAPRRLPSSLFAMGVVGVHTGWAVGGKGGGQ